MKITAVYQHDPKSGWRVVRTIELPAAISQGRTMDEARTNLIDAIHLVLLDLRETAEKQRTPDMVQEQLEIAA